MTTENAPSVIHDGETSVQVSIVAEHVFYDIIVETVLLEQRIVRFEIYVGTCFVLRIFCDVRLQDASLESCLTHLSVTIAGHLEMRTQRIHRLYTHTIQTYGLLESLRVVLTTSVQHADGFDELALRDASSIVTNGDAQVFVDGDFQSVACLHLKLVDGVINDFFQQNVDTVFGQRAVAQTSDIHSWTSADVLHIRQVPDVVVVIFDDLFLGDYVILF